MTVHQISDFEKFDLFDYILTDSTKNLVNYFCFSLTLQYLAI
jgi:hypothetical protein